MAIDYAKRKQELVKLYKSGLTADAVVDQVKDRYPGISKWTVHDAVKAARAAGEEIPARKGGHIPGKARKSKSSGGRKRKPKAKPTRFGAGGPRGGKSTYDAKRDAYRVNVWLPSPVYQALRMFAAEEMQTQTDVIVAALRQHIGYQKYDDLVIAWEPDGLP